MEPLTYFRTICSDSVSPLKQKTFDTILESVDNKDNKDEGSSEYLADYSNLTHGNYPHDTPDSS